MLCRPHSVCRYYTTTLFIMTRKDPARREKTRQLNPAPPQAAREVSWGQGGVHKPKT